MCDYCVRNPINYITSVLKSLHWLPVSENLLQNPATCLESTNDISPKYISDLLVQFERCRPLVLSGRGLLDYGSKSHKKTKAAFSYFTAFSLVAK